MKFPEPRRFFITRRSKPELSPRFPARCPHCLGPATKRVTIGRTMPTSRGGRENMSFEIGVCKAMRTPAITYVGILTLGFFAVLSALIGGVRFIDGPSTAIAPAMVFAILAAAIAWLARGYMAIRFVRWGQGEIWLKIRDRDYAVEVADLNGGYLADRVIG